MRHRDPSHRRSDLQVLRSPEKQSLWGAYLSPPVEAAYAQGARLISEEDSADARSNQCPECLVIAASSWRARKLGMIWTPKRWADGKALAGNKSIRDKQLTRGRWSAYGLFNSLWKNDHIVNRIEPTRSILAVPRWIMVAIGESCDLGDVL